MKIKKIIALAAATIMAFSTVANAAVSFSDADGVWVSDARPTRAGLDSRQITATIATEKILAADAKTLGVSLGVGTNKKDDTTHDYYKLTLNISDLGDLYWAYNSETYNEAEPDQVQLYSLQIKLPGIEAATIATKSSFNGKAWDSSADGALWTAVSAAATDLYPACTYDDVTPLGVYLENASADELVIAFAVAKEYTYEATPEFVTVYQLNPSDNGNTVANSKATIVATCNGVSSGNKVKFAAPAPADPTYPIDMTAEGKIANENGYIWALTFGENASYLDTLTATFATADDSLAKEIPAAAITAITGGTTTLNVGLKTTTKVLTSATFVATNTDTNTEATTAVVNY